MRRTRITLACVSGAAIVLFALPVFAQTPAEKIHDLDQKIASYTQQLNQKGAEEKNLQSMIDTLDITIAQTDAEIEKTTLAISQTEESIVTTTEQITEAKQILTEKTQQLTLLVQELYGLDHKTFLEVVFSKTTLADLLNQMEYTQNLETRIHTIVRETQDVKAQLQQKRIDQEQNRNDLQTQKNNQNIYQDSLTSQRESQQELLQHINDAESYYQSLLQDAQNEITQTQSTVTYPSSTHPKLTNTDVSFIWPIDSRIITCGFHCPNYPYDYPHNGLDIATLKGTPVRAVASGYVSRAVWDGTPNLAWVRIKHTPTLATEYLHLSVVSVVPDQYVEQGDILGYSGGVKYDIGSGSHSTGAHLHLTVFDHLVAVDPLQYLP